VTDTPGSAELPRVGFTSELGLTVRGDGDALRGRTVTFGETAFSVGEDPAPVAIALSTFVASPRPQDLGLNWADTVQVVAVAAARG
jgi:hypothetical protein